MRCKIRCLSTGLSSITSICTSRFSNTLLRSRAGLRRWETASQALVYRVARPPAASAPSLPQHIVHNTIQQTIIHLHQPIHRQSFTSSADAGSKSAELVIRQTPAAFMYQDSIDPSRPTLMARRLLRILSADSAQSVLKPYFFRIFQSFREQERESKQDSPLPSAPEVRTGLSGWEFQALVQSVAAALSHDSRLQALRQGRRAGWLS